MPAAIASSTRAAIQAATDYGEARNAVLVPVREGAKFDACLPASDVERARALVSQFARAWTVESEASAYQAVAGLAKATAAGELFETQIRAIGRRYTLSIEKIAREFAKEGKYTKEHAAAMVAARERLASELGAIVPPSSYYKFEPIPLQSIGTDAKLSKRLEALSGMSGKPAANLARNIVKEGRDAITYADETPIVLNIKYAEKLSKLGNVLTAVELLPSAATALLAEDDRERQKALITFVSKAYGTLAEQAVSRGGLYLCVALTLSTGGWGFLACGLTAVGTGIIAGAGVEKLMTKTLTVP
jgi:hypothetical protein